MNDYYRNIDNSVIINKPWHTWRLKISKNNLTKKKKKIIWVGYPYPAQGLEFLLKIANKMQDVNFFILGDPQPAWKKWYNDLKSNSPKNIFFQNAKSPKKLLKYMAKFDAGIIPRDERLPNNQIALPNKFFEYLASGLPIISTNFLEFKKFLDEYNFGSLIFYDQIDESINSINNFFANQKNILSNKNVISKLAYWDTEQKKLHRLLEKHNL